MAKHMEWKPSWHLLYAADGFQLYPLIVHLIMNGEKNNVKNTHIFKIFSQPISSVLSEAAVLLTDDYFWLHLASNYKKTLPGRKIILNS